MRLRTCGDGFFAQFALSDPRAALARQLAPALIQQFPGHDDRLAAFDSLAAGTLKLGEHAQNTLAVYEPAVLKTLKDVAKLCDAACARSHVEHERLARHLEYRPRPAFELPVADTPVPVQQSGAGEVVIWAPLSDAADIALLAFALEELHAPVVAVCRSGSLPGLRALTVHANGAADALAQARVVVDAQLDHAGNAIALTRHGFTVCSSITSGACEYLYGVLEYEPWNHRSVFSAVCTALGSQPAQEQTVHLPAFVQADVPLDGPLVSIVVRTYNRRDLLPRALDSLAAQTYGNLEIVVVNDGGADVADIVARYPRARYLPLETNGGTSAAGNAGLRAAGGTFVGFLDDDDLVFPEHVATLVAALQNSGAAAAHTDTIGAHFEREADGSYRTTGYVVFLDGLVEPTDFYVTDAVGPMAVLMKRSIVLAAGGFDERLSHAEDWELFLKLAQQYDVIHVPRITGMYSIRHDGTHMMSNAGPQIARSMEQLMQLHPLPHRPVMETARRQALENYRKAGYAMRFPEPALRRP